MEMNHYFDTAHPLRPYTHSLPANPGTFPPDNALRGEQPSIKKNFWPCAKNDAWVDVEDHRKRTEAKGFPAGTEQEGTEYWLPGDTWQTQARLMVAIGPLPTGAKLEKPEPTEAELCTMRIAEIKGELQAIDAAKVRPMSAIIEDTATEDEHVRLAELNALADALRAELQMLEAFIVPLWEG